MRFIRAIVYRFGFRPRLGSIFHSPSLSGRIAVKAMLDGFTEGIRKADRS